MSVVWKSQTIREIFIIEYTTMLGKLTNPEDGIKSK
jgi:hypothetical protein